jgi:OOP family OmpA-OmpF porin
VCARFSKTDRACIVQSMMITSRENIMKQTNRTILICCTLLLTSSLAFAGKVAPKGYLVDSANDPVKSGFGLCWHTGTWTPADATVEGCDDMLKPAPAPVPAPKANAAEPAPAPASPAPAAASAQEASAPVPVVAAAPTSEKVTFEADTFFDFDKFALKPAGKAKLEDLVSKLIGTDIEVVVATGHTDSVGSDAYNQKLSMRRANAVKAFLVSKGIPADRIFTEGKGESKPVASNKTSDGRAKNRRVDVEVVGNRKK